MIAFRRIVTAIPTLLSLSFFVFLLLELAPGDVTSTILDQSASEETREQVRYELRADRPLLLRYTDYIGNLLHGDMGHSIRTGRPVTQEISIRLPYTLALIGASVVAGTLSGTILGTVAAFKHNTIWDSLVRVVISIGMSVPTFWLALLLVSLFALRLHWLPVFGAEGFKHLILPALCTSFALVPGVARMTRASLLEVFGSDYITVARSKGLSNIRILSRHISPVAVIPVVTYVGFRVVHLITSVVVIEIIFNWPGLGGLAVKAAFDRDPLLLQGATLTIAFLTFIILFAVDLIVVYLDPRIVHKAV